MMSRQQMNPMKIHYCLLLYPFPYDCMIYKVNCLGTNHTMTRLTLDHFLTLKAFVFKWIIERPAMQCQISFLWFFFQPSITF